MIAENVRGTLFGNIAEGLYSAYVSSSAVSNRSAYVVTRRSIKEYFDGIVLAKLKNVTVKSLHCLYEKSCGGIIFYKTRQNVKILLVKNNNGRYWSFPKGHIEDGETEQETAIREIKEETGLDVTLVNNFREISEYCPFGKIRKRVVFFLARAFTDNVRIQEEEIDSYIWVDLQQARKLCSYDNDLRIIEKAETTIHLMRN